MEVKIEGQVNLALVSKNKAAKKRANMESINMQSGMAYPLPISPYNTLKIGVEFFKV